MAVEAGTQTVIAPRKSLTPWISDDLSYYPHQIDGVRTLCRMNNFLLADEMGLGKSLQALTVFAVDVKLGVAETMIIVCPVTLKGNWQDEITLRSKFPVTVLGVSESKRNRKGKIIPLTKGERSQQINDFTKQTGPRILVVNYEQVVAHVQELNTIFWDIRLFDEAHYLKNHKSQRTKAAMKLYGKRTFLLTGTPMLNHVNELWTLLHMIDPVRFPSYWKFVNRYCLFGGFEDKQIVGVKNHRELTEVLSQYQIRRLAKDVLDLKEPQIIPVRVDLSPEQRELYDQVFEEEVINIPDNPTPKEVENALVKFGVLKQICGTTATISGHGDSSYKLDRAIDIVEELSDDGHKVVIFTQYRKVLACFEARMRKSLPKIPLYALHGDVPQDERVPLVKKWGSTRGPAVLVVMLQVGGIGLNMAEARHCIFLDKLFVPGLNDQALRRLVRIPQTSVVQVYEMICRNTIESRVETILKMKRKINDETVEQAKIKRELVMSLLGKSRDQGEE